MLLVLIRRRACGESRAITSTAAAMTHQIIIDGFLASLAVALLELGLLERMGDVKGTRVEPAVLIAAVPRIIVIVGRRCTPGAGMEAIALGRVRRWRRAVPVQVPGIIRRVYIIVTATEACTRVFRGGVARGSAAIQRGGPRAAGTRETAMHQPRCPCWTARLTPGAVRTPLASGSGLRPLERITLSSPCREDTTTKRKFRFRANGDSDEG